MEDFWRKNLDPGSEFSRKRLIPKPPKSEKIDKNLPPIIDGDISDEVWKEVDWQTDFVELQPDENTQPSNQTKFKLLFDDNAIYVFVKSLINPDEIVNRLTRRDQLDGDAIYIAFDSNNDKINSFVFGLLVTSYAKIEIN